MRELSQDFRFAVRMLLRSPGVSAVAIITLALALGANTAIFSVVQAVLLRPLPFPSPDQLVVVSSRNEINGDTRGAHSHPNYVDLAQQAKSLEALGAWTNTSSFLMDSQEPERVYGALASASTFTVLGVRPHLGRFFTAAEDTFGAPPVVMISHDLWQRKYNGDRGVIGRQIQIGSAGKTRTLVGVMPPGFRFPVGGERPDFWMPLEPEVSEGSRNSRGAIWLDLVGRVKTGTTLAAANGELASISRRLSEQYPDSNEGELFLATPLYEQVVGDVRPAILVLLASVGAVLLIGCANVANLLLARAAGRRREMAIRSALGASRARVIRQLLVESVVLSVVAGAVGLLLAVWSIDLLVALAPDTIPRLENIGIDRQVLLFTAALSIVTGLVFGMVPAIGASRTDLNETLKEGSRGSTEGRGRARVRNLLVVAEITLSLALLVSAGLLIRSFAKLTSVDPGFRPEGLTYLNMSVRSAVAPEDADVARNYQRIMEMVAATPGVTSVGSVSSLPMSGSDTVFGVWPVERPPASGPETKVARHVAAMPGAIETLGIRLLAGRTFTPRDDASAPAVALVSQALAAEHFGKENPIGRRINITDGDGEREIVGIVADVKFDDLSTPAAPTIWVSQLQDTTRYQQIVVRSSLPTGTAVNAIRSAIRSLDPQQPILASGAVSEIIGESLASRRFSMTLLTILSGLALLLSAVGIYSVMSYSVSQRTSEIGIRMALGADSRAILRMVVRGAIRLVAVGVVAGVLLALFSGRVLQSMLYGIAPNDPVTLTLIAVLLGAVAMIASWLPARRAARVDPLEAIRYE